MFLGRVGVYQALLVLGALMLVVTGGEAMYADLGHFGALPIRISWFALVYPALLLNYLGQGAYLLGGAPIVGGKIFYSLVPPVLLYPMILLATAATVIASQALISGAFSLASQATGLGLFPRLQVLHTHHAHAGQIYIPFVNWALYAGCVVLVVTFGSSAALGAAYGLAVSGVMVITSLAMFPVSRLCWGWGTIATGLLWGALTTINGSFLLASSLKFLEGGFVPLSIGMAVFLVMATWRWGRKATFAAYSRKETMTIAELIQLHRSSRFFMERTAVLMAPTPLHHPSDRTPALLQLLWDRYGVLPRNLIFVQVTHRKVPVHSRRSVCGHRVRQGQKRRQHHRRRVEFRLHGGAQCGACARRHGAPEGDRLADGPSAVDRARVARESVAGAVDGPDPATSLPAVHVLAARLAARILLLRAGRRGAVVGRDTAGSGAVISTHP